MIEVFQLPSPTPIPADRSYPAWRDWLLSNGDRWLNYLNSWVGQKFVPQFNSLLTGYGKDIASAATITVSNAVNQVTGSTPITTINQPMGQTAVAVLALYAKDGFSLATGGNIATAVSVPAGSAVLLAYHPVLQQWIAQASGGTFSQVVLLKSSTDSPYSVPSGSLFVAVTLDAGNFVANLSATPNVGDTVTFKVLTNPGGTSEITINPASGMTIDGAGVLNILAINSARSLVYAGSNQWMIYASF